MVLSIYEIRHAQLKTCSFAFCILTNEIFHVLILLPHRHTLQTKNCKMIFIFKFNSSKVMFYKPIFSTYFAIIFICGGGGSLFVGSPICFVRRNVISVVRNNFNKYFTNPCIYYKVCWDVNSRGKVTHENQEHWSPTNIDNYPVTETRQV